MDYKIDIPFNPVIKVNEIHTINYLRIRVEHDKGGYSWATDEIHKTGVTCHITPIMKQDRSVSTLYDCKTEHQGFFVFCVPCGRKSPKKIEKVFNAVEPLAETIMQMFVDKKYSEIAALITDACKDIK